MVNDTEKERIRLAEADLAQTNEFIRGVLTTGSALRGSAVTIWLALLGFAVQQRLALLAVLAAIVAVVFLLTDGYHGWLYTQAFAHARAIENLLSLYYDALSRSRDDPAILPKFKGQLRAHRYGLYRNLRVPFTLQQVWLARPRLFYRGLYPFLFVSALLLALLVEAGAIGSAEPQPTRVVIEPNR